MRTRWKQLFHRVNRGDKIVRAMVISVRASSHLARALFLISLALTTQHVNGNEVERNFAEGQTIATVPPLPKKEASYIERAKSLGHGCNPSDNFGKLRVAVIDLDELYSIPSVKPGKLMPPSRSQSNSTVQGLDRDQDCVRDDIEHYIVSKFEDDHQLEIRAALYDYALWLGLFLNEGLNKNDALAIDRELARSGDCLGNIIGANQAPKETQLLFSELINTFDRSLRFIENSNLIAGQTQLKFEEVACGTL